MARADFAVVTADSALDFAALAVETAVAALDSAVWMRLFHDSTVVVSVLT